MSKNNSLLLLKRKIEKVAYLMWGEKIIKLGMVAHACDSGTQKAEGNWEFQAILATQ